MWVITAPENFIIKLTFKIYTLDGADRHTLVKVRDGDTRQSDLLVRDYGGGVPETVTSSQNVMLVEFVMPVERRRVDMYDVDNQGLVAVYEALGRYSLVGLGVCLDGYRNILLFCVCVCVCVCMGGCVCIL